MSEMKTSGLGWLACMAIAMLTVWALLCYNLGIL